MASAKSTMLFCVRRSDAISFPAPNSQFVGTSETENTLDRCRYVCGTEDIDVYKLDDMALETEEMVAVEGGASYGDLPSAFQYRESPNFKKCDFHRYHRKVNLARAKAVTPDNVADVVIPLPTPRPEPSRVARSSPAYAIDPIITSGTSTAKRKVRVVLPGLVPEDAPETTVTAASIPAQTTIGKTLTTIASVIMSDAMAGETMVPEVAISAATAVETILPVAAILATAITTIWICQQSGQIRSRRYRRRHPKGQSL